ncbi:hypothetical protein OAJ18_02815 [Pelagibacteraceae bacterium]|nr:hypothetical protein [Pelagibacteraceae bacterium]
MLKTNGYFLFDRAFFEGMAAANNYKIIFSSYIVVPGTETRNGSEHEFHVPVARSMLDSIDYAKVRQIAIHAVMQKQENAEFKIPYEGDFMRERYNCAGFNRIYFKDPLSWSAVPSAKYSTEEAPFKLLVKEFFRRLFKKIKRKIF